MFVDMDQDPCVKRPFLERLDLVAQRVEPVVFHALRSRFQQNAAVRTFSYIAVHSLCTPYDTMRKYLTCDQKRQVATLVNWITN